VWLPDPAQAGAHFPAGPASRSHLGRHPVSAWAGVPSPPGPTSRPRLGRRLAPGWAGASPPAGPVPRPGWAGSSSRPVSLSCPGWAGMVPRLGQGLRRPAGPLLFLQADFSRPEFPAQAGILYAGWLASAHYSGRARPGFPGPGRITPYVGRNSSSPTCFTYPASTPVPCASPGTPLGSDWHILHRHMLVLGRPLAQTSISLLS
jgi:hypothetical protein